MARNIKIKAPKRLGNKSSISRGAGTYLIPEQIGKQAAWWWQGIGRIRSPTIPNIKFTVAYKDQIWEGEPLFQGDAGSTSDQFSIDIDGNLICDRNDCTNFSIDQSTGQVVYIPS